MIARDKIINFINDYLDIEAAPEQNGLQVEGTDKIHKIAFGVSANLDTFKAAHKLGADMIIVHHGLIWDKPQQISGVFGERVKFLIKNDINLAAYHLPLDMHKVVGNNASLAKLIGLKSLKPFGDYHGLKIGVKGVFPTSQSIEDICKILGGDCLLTGKEKVKTAAIVSGGAHDMVEQAIKEGVDLFITGTRDEYIVSLCTEAEINFITMGHYNSEKFGIRELERIVKNIFAVDTVIIEEKNPF
ncbi:MAG: Nif3-like dinuclear metal center hexameric protein [Elusimicrobiota bacterium]|jgi:dinuclear metal center YbgI/SA1388 family protein|nr:Nif3-like dinuclear metal center hexameric protein [Elusimicrobiota bacterium]